MPSLSLADSSATESRPAGHTWLNALQQGDCMHLIYATINNSAWECACTSLLAQWMMLRGSLPIMAVPCWHVKCVCGTLSSCSANIFAAFTCQGMAAPEPTLAARGTRRAAHARSCTGNADTSGAAKSVCRHAGALPGGARGSRKAAQHNIGPGHRGFVGAACLEAAKLPGSGPRPTRAPQVAPSAPPPARGLILQRSGARPCA